MFFSIISHINLQSCHVLSAFLSYKHVFLFAFFLVLWLPFSPLHICIYIYKYQLFNLFFKTLSRTSIQNFLCLSRKFDILTLKTRYQSFTSFLLHIFLFLYLLYIDVFLYLSTSPPKHFHNQKPLNF